VCVFITSVPITKLFAWGGGGDNGRHVLRGTTSRGRGGLVCPSRTSERGGEGYCVKGGGGEEGERERERARLIHDNSQLTACLTVLHCARCYYKYSVRCVCVYYYST
jgi:hypothetical protein